MEVVEKKVLDSIVDSNNQPLGPQIERMVESDWQMNVLLIRGLGGSGKTALTSEIGELSTLRLLEALDQSAILGLVRQERSWLETPLADYSQKQEYEEFLVDYIAVRKHDLKSLDPNALLVTNTVPRSDIQVLRRLRKIGDVNVINMVGHDQIMDNTEVMRTAVVSADPEEVFGVLDRFHVRVDLDDPEEIQSRFINMASAKQLRDSRKELVTLAKMQVAGITLTPKQLEITRLPESFGDLPVVIREALQDIAHLLYEQTVYIAGFSPNRVVMAFNPHTELGENEYRYLKLAN